MFKAQTRGIAVAGFIALASVMTATNSYATDVSINKWIDKITFSGDMRLRQEFFHKNTVAQDRSRQRFRLRINTNFDLPNQFKVNLTLASGTGEQVSTNQTFDNLSSQKSIWIDKAYVSWKPFEMLSLQGGRMANPFWTQYSSDAVWDGDFNPEGFSEGVSTLLGPVSVFANGLQMVVDEDSSNNTTEGTAANTTVSAGNKQNDQWMIGTQIGAEIKLPLETRFKAAYANYNWINERKGDFGAGVNNEGNRRTGGVLSSTGSLVNNFNVNEFTGVFSAWVGRLPVQLQGTYIVNTAAREAFSPKEDTGYQFGTIIGKAKDKNTFEVAYFNKHVRSDATVADVADSDFGDGGTNRKGHIFWVAYAPQEWMLCSVKYFNTKVINANIAPGADDIRRTQIDFSVKF